MTMIMEFADQLFLFLAMKYEVIYVKGPEDVLLSAEACDWSATDQFTVEIGHAVMMLAYSYRPHFKKQFHRLLPLLSTHDPEGYAIIFAEQTYKSHSPLKILVLCAFISEMYLFLLYQSDSTRVVEDYILPSSACFNSVYKAVLRHIDDPILKWDHVKFVANLIDCGYDVFEPLMRTEHPSEETDFFDSIAALTADASEDDVELYNEELQSQVRGAETISTRNLQRINKNLYKTLKIQSRSLFPQTTQPVIIHCESFSKTSNGRGNATLGASGSGANLGASGSGANLGASGSGANLGASGSGANLGASGSGANLGASGSGANLGGSGATLGASGSGSTLNPSTRSLRISLKVGPSASVKIPVSDGKAESSKQSKYNRKDRRKTKVSTMMAKEAAARIEEKELARLKQANDQAIIDHLLGLGPNPIANTQKSLLDESDTDEADLGKFSDLTLKERRTDDTEDEPEGSFKEYLV